jgi:hypothetical protein
MAQTELIADGKRHGIAMTDYVLERIRDKSLTPAVVVDVVGANVHKNAIEMLEEGISREDVATWVQNSDWRAERSTPSLIFLQVAYQVSQAGHRLRRD